MLFLLLISILLSIPAVQTKIAKYATQKINDDFGVDLVIQKVDLSFLGNVELKGIEIRDHHKDTLIFVNNLSTSVLNAKKVLEGEIKLGTITLEDVQYHMTTYKGEENDNMAIFIENFEDNAPKDSLSSPFILETSLIKARNLNFILINENDQVPLGFSAKNIYGSFEDFSIVGSDVSANVKNLNFIDNRGLEVSNLTTDFTYTLSAMGFENTTLQTKNSTIKAQINFSYKRKDLAMFNDKVGIKAIFNESKISLLDLKKYYKEFNGSDQLNFTGTINGKLNDFTVSNLNLHSEKGIKIIGNTSFTNAVNRERGVVFKGNLKNVTATYRNLKNALPNLLGKTLPVEFDRLGTFILSGLLKVSPEQMNATLSVNSEIGTTTSDLQITNIDDIENAKYNGEIEFRDFDIGKFFRDPLFGKVSLNGDVDGSGFKLDNINTRFIGNVSLFGFKGYNYQNIIANGIYQNNKFDGDLTIDDEHLKMKFKGLADFSSKVHKFDFNSDISYVNLKETNLFLRDSISLLKGNIAIDIEGNTLDDVIGKATFENIFYTNQQKEYSFKKFHIDSSVKDSIKTIKVISKDIANGFVKGKFTFAELLPVTQNALGSIYTNYSPYKVGRGQFLDFNFTVYNQIINIFFPEISIDDKTKIKGKIQPDKNELKLTISSPRINVYGYEVKNVLLRTDNQNALYNSHLTASEVNTKYYKVSKLNLLNRTQNDTLFFKSVFKGGIKKNEEFNLDFFYTFNPEGKAVIGLEKSSFEFKENVWNINPKNKNTNKVTFSLKEGEFNFSPFKVTSQEQKIEFKGSLKGDEEKILLANFTKVNLESFLPEIDSLRLKGKLSGSLDFIQKEDMYSPQGVLTIEDYEVNSFKQGDLALNVKGENSYEKYSVELSLKNEKVKSIEAVGFLDFSSKSPLIDLSVSLEEFGLSAFSPLGEDVLSSIRGTASGNFTLKGFLGNPEMDGILRLNRAGLRFPYLNIDYDFEGESRVSLEGQSFFLEDIKLRDTKHNTQGSLKGSITHSKFDLWFLNININTNDLLVLDTENTEEALYYGTAFLNGDASITGLTDQLTIDVNGKTEARTIFVVPLKDIETVNNYKLIYFKSDKTFVKEKQKEVALEALKGLSLNINLEVTKDATAQVVIDEVNGSQLSGNGTGNLDIRINTRGKFEMFGDYIIDKGIYDFKYARFVNKPFVIQKGGTISWSGNPYEANLDVTAVYKANANPGVLLENFNSNRNIEVDLVTKITGGLFNSKQELDIQLPNVDPTIANELEFILNDNDENQKTTQFISLLALDNFVNPDGLDIDARATVTNTASSAISAAFSRLMNSPDSKFQIEAGFKSGQDDTNLNTIATDDQVDVSVITQVSDRVIINGKVGVPIGTKTQASVVGEVKIEVLLNKVGNLRGVIFNRQNEIQYSTEEEGYTQGIGLSYQVNFNTLSDLLTKVGLKKKLKKSKKKVKKDTISSLHKELINFEGN